MRHLSLAILCAALTACDGSAPPPEPAAERAAPYDPSPSPDTKAEVDEPVDVQEAEGPHETNAAVEKEDGPAKPEAPAPATAPAAPPSAKPSPAAPSSAVPKTSPFFSYFGRGQTTCDGKHYETTAGMTAVKVGAKLHVATTRAHIKCGGSCEKKANAKLQQSAIGETVYTLVTDAVAQKAGVNEAFLAPFITKKSGEVIAAQPYTAVFPIAAPSARFAKLRSAPRVIVAKIIAGQDVFTMRTTLSVVEYSDYEVLLSLENVILPPHDEPKTAARLFEGLPMPRKALYRIDTHKRTITEMLTEHHWLGDQNCDGNAERTALNYLICEKRNGAKVDAFPCGT